MGYRRGSSPSAANAKGELVNMLALDIFCGGGGATIGLQQAGFEVIGIDIKRQKNYPATLIVGDIHNLPVDPMDFPFVWASPPCQHHSKATRVWGDKYKDHPDLVLITREILKGHPFSVIENVPGCPLRPDVRLTGPSVGLFRLERLRIFECSFFMMHPPAPQLERWRWEQGIAGTITKSMSSNSHYKRREEIGLPGRIPNWEAKEIMGIPDGYRMTNDQIGEAVPPPMAYSIAREAMRQIKENYENKKNETLDCPPTRSI